VIEMDKLPDMDRYRKDLNELEGIVNTSPRKVEEIGRLIPYHFHNTLEQQFCRMALSYVREVATGDRVRLGTDPRNEESHRLCKKIYKLLKENGDDLKYISLPMI
jgi:RimJ/RimL family protein N-acetyltransferase